MRKGDCKVKVYWACNTTAAAPIPAAERKSSPKSFAGIRGDFDRLLRARLGAVESQRHRMAPSDRRYACVEIAELFAKEKDVAEAFFDQRTTAAWQPNLGTLRLRS
jgi:hypothetical protein